jgi:hypothetical protein
MEREKQLEVENYAIRWDTVLFFDELSSTLDCCGQPLLQMI